MANKVATLRLRRIVARHNLLSDEKLEEAVALAEKEEKALSTILTERRLVDRDKLLEIISLETRYPAIDLEKLELEDGLKNILSKELVEHFMIVPIAKLGDILTVVVADPFDIYKLDDLSALTNCQIRPVIGLESSIKRAIERLYKEEEKEFEMMVSAARDAQIEVREGEEMYETVDLTKITDEESPIVKFVNMLLSTAIKEGISDIHFEPYEKYVRIRYRKDGMLYDSHKPPKSWHSALISRIKVLSNLDIAERHAPQDGKLQVKFEGRNVDVRVSILPSVHGEKGVLRILDSASLNMSLEQLGFEKQSLEIFRRAINAPYGIILVTGPTGSGKSTTLYASLKEIMSEDESIVTVEDPVEYQIEKIAQIPVNPKRGVTFANALRTILRQDPDIIMIGEIRDLETADIAVKAAITGHLVLSTLHTNDAASSITRLIDMGLEPYMVASALIMVSAQRLMRKLCENCKQIDPLLPPRERLLRIGFKPEEIENLKLYRPIGCPVCKGGYRGRFAILEALEIDDYTRKMIVENKTSFEIKKYAMEQKDMFTLRRCALLNVKRGITSLEEAISTTMAD
jgi:type IV pilus assembly protein PilB